MKTRQGFVSNSSSTSFTFIFKGGNVKDLSDTILEHKNRKHFNLSFDAGWGDSNDVTYTCNAQDVAEAIEECVEGTKGHEWREIKVISIEGHIVELIERQKQNNDYIKKKMKREEKECDSACHKTYSSYGHLQEYTNDLTRQIDKLRQAKKRGLTSVLVIGFGDNDGDVSGGDLGYCMDYDGRNISIDNDNFIVLTEQNR